jgi:hypothetical protein
LAFNLGHRAFSFYFFRSPITEVYEAKNKTNGYDEGHDCFSFHNLPPLSGKDIFLPRIDIFFLGLQIQDTGYHEMK